LTPQQTLSSLLEIFCAYYTEHVGKHWRAPFPNLVCYTHIVAYLPSVFIPLVIHLRCCCLGKCTGISFIDSTALAVCSNQRIHAQRVFAVLAQGGQTSSGWFSGSKLHEE